MSVLHKSPICISPQEPRVPDKPNPVREKLPPVPPLAPITPWADRQRPSGVGGESGDKPKETTTTRHSSAGEGRLQKRLKKKDRKRPISREFLLDSDDESEVRCHFFIYPIYPQKFNILNFVHLQLHSEHRGQRSRESDVDFEAERRGRGAKSAAEKEGTHRCQISENEQSNFTTATLQLYLLM